MADADVAKAVLGGIHNVSSSILKGQAAVFDQALPGTSTVVTAATDALGGIWKAAGMLPDDPATAASKAAAAEARSAAALAEARAAAALAEARQATALAEARSAAALAEARSAAATLPGTGGLLSDPRVAQVANKGVEKVAWYLAKRGILTPPPPPPEEALRTAPPVVDGQRVVAVTAQKAAGVDGTRLSRKDGL